MRLILYNPHKNWLFVKRWTLHHRSIVIEYFENLGSVSKRIYDGNDIEFDNYTKKNKVVKREIILKNRASKFYDNTGDALEAFNELVKLKEEQKESEKLAFWDSVDVKDLTPILRKDYKEIMRKEVRSK